MAAWLCVYTAGDVTSDSGVLELSCETYQRPIL
jgi:hypothetical protein